MSPCGSCPINFAILTKLGAGCLGDTMKNFNVHHLLDKIRISSYTHYPPDPLFSNHEFHIPYQQCLTYKMHRPTDLQHGPNAISEESRRLRPTPDTPNRSRSPLVHKTMAAQLHHTPPPPGPSRSTPSLSDVSAVVKPQPSLSRDNSVPFQADSQGNQAPPEVSKTISPDSSAIAEYSHKGSDGRWACTWPGCTSQSRFTRACDLRKHYKRHRKTLFCRQERCPRATEGGFSSKKDRARHEAKHNPMITCDWEGCGRLFSRKDNMVRVLARVVKFPILRTFAKYLCAIQKDHIRRIHKQRAAGGRARANHHLGHTEGESAAVRRTTAPMTARDA